MTECTITYTYDNLNRVIRKERSDGAVVEFEYDKQGRLAKKMVKRPESGITIKHDLTPNSVVTREDVKEIAARMIIYAATGAQV